MEKNNIDGWKLLRNNNFSNTFRDKHCNTTINNNRQNSFTIKEINKIIKRDSLWDIILTENEDFIKNIPKYKHLSLNKWDTPPGKEWYYLFKKMHPEHTEESYNKSVKNLSLIANYGWSLFVNKYPIF